jgi:hypothetical protein
LYDRWYKRSELVRSTLMATVVLLAGYALLPEQYRFSRAIILFGALLAFLLISLLRGILIQSKVLSSRKEKEENANTIIVASATEYDTTIQLMQAAGLKERVLGRVAINDDDNNGLGNWKTLKQFSSTIPFREVIFCEGSLSFKDIIGSLQVLPKDCRIKFHANGSGGIVGSDSKNSLGEALSKENGYRLAYPYNRRLKRLLDVSVALAAIITFPVHFFFVKKPFHFFAHCFSVLFARKTWVSYILPDKSLPALRPGIITSNGLPASIKQQLPAVSLHMMDQWYARDYEPANDLHMIKNIYRRLGE